MSDITSAVNWRGAT